MGKKSNQIHKLLKGKSVSQILKKVCGEFIGYGLYRDVYVLKQFPEYVVKIERDMSTANFANVTEWRNWIDNKDWEWFSKWLAPCEMISETGQVLIQKKVQVKERKFYPKKIPACFTDRKTENFGFINDQFVCCDYSLLINSSQPRKMRNANWWTLKKKNT